MSYKEGDKVLTQWGIQKPFVAIVISRVAKWRRIVVYFPFRNVKADIHISNIIKHLTNEEYEILRTLEEL